MNQQPVQFLRYSALIMLMVLPLVSGGSQQGVTPKEATRDTRPNILILMAEDMSDRVGAFGDPVAVTPTLDKLAASGLRFPNTFTSAGVCAPSRAAHITGMHQISIGGQHMRTSSYKPEAYQAVPPPEVKAYPEILRRNGYYTLTNHKLDYQFSRFGAGSGPFTIWDHEGENPDWNQRGEGQPFFALINFGATHESQLFEKNVKKNREKGLIPVVSPGQVTVPPYYPDTPTARKDIAQQYNNIFAMDQQVGELLAKLEADGLADNTIVIWTTDHGDGLPRAKREIYDSGIKVPMIIRWPQSLRPNGTEVGSIDERLISFVDFAPSVLTWAGITIPGYMHGRPTMADLQEKRQYIFASKDRLDEFPFRERAVRDQRYKYLYNYQAGEPGAKHIAYRDQLDLMAELWVYFEEGRMSDQQAFWFNPRPEEELYDLAFDPHEVNNLINDPQYLGELTRLRAAYADWQFKVADLSELPEAEMANRFWPNLEQPVTSEPRIRLEDGRVLLDCDTSGASIAYRLNDGRWQVYTGPFDLPPGSSISAKAVRYGWRGSEEVLRNQ